MLRRKEREELSEQAVQVRLKPYDKISVLLFAIDHIGIAVKNLEASILLYSKLFGIEAEEIEVEDVPSEGIRVGIVAGESYSIELMEPTSEDSAVFKFLEKRGEGIHHICYKTNNVDEKMRQLTSMGFELVTNTPRVGTGGRRIVFLHPKSAGGVLVEFKEKGHSESHRAERIGGKADSTARGTGGKNG